MPRTEAANQRLRDAQRAKILDAARQVFARKGMAATMAEIAAAAEVSQGLAYRYFASKEAIITELLNQTSAANSASMQRILDMPGTPGERLEFLLSMIFKYGSTRLEYYQLFRQALDGDDALPADLRELMLRPGKNFQSVLRQLIVEGQASGEIIADDPDQLVIALIACFDGLSRLALRGSERLTQHFPDIRIILRMVKP